MIMGSGWNGREDWRGIVLLGRSTRGVYRGCKMDLGSEGKNERCEICMRSKFIYWKRVTEIAG
jgi:hypothetical protein